MIPVRGTVHIENCLNQDYCYLPVTPEWLVLTQDMTTAEKREEIVAELEKTEFKQPFQRMLVKNNSFINNTAYPVLSAQQTGSCSV